MTFKEKMDYIKKTNAELKDMQERDYINVKYDEGANWQYTFVNSGKGIKVMAVF